MKRVDFLFSILKFPARVYYNSLFNIKITKNELGKYKGPVFVIGNHVAAHDSQISILTTNRMIRFVAAEINWENKWKKLAFEILEIIPVVRKRSDTKAVRAMKQAANEGHCVGLYPEAERTWDGKTLPIISSSSKLAKLLGVPVYNVRTKGLYLSRPRWSVYPRYGKVEVEITQVLSQEQVQTMKKSEIQAVIADAIEYNEFDWQREEMIVYKGKRRAEGIQRILYVCENCEAINSFSARLDEFTCSKCKKTYTINKYGFIEGSERFDNTADWNKWQKPFIDKLVSNGFSFKMKNMEMTVHRDEIIEKKIDLQFTPQGLSLYFIDERRYFKIDIAEIDSCNAVLKHKLEVFICGVKHVFTFDITKNHMSIELFEELLSTLTAR